MEECAPDFWNAAVVVAQSLAGIAVSENGSIDGEKTPFTVPWSASLLVAPERAWASFLAPFSFFDGVL